MEESELKILEAQVYNQLKGMLGTLPDDRERAKYIEGVSKGINPSLSSEEIKRIINDATNYYPIGKYLGDPNIEDIMINNTQNIFLYTSDAGQIKAPERIESKFELDLLVKKFMMFATTATSHERIVDVHLQNGSRVNIVDSPLGANITIRNFKSQAFSIIDLINKGELSYKLAARLWIYTDGLKTRPANILIGGMPASGKTTLLNAMFSFFRPEERIVTIEETYELNTSTQENCVRLETDPEITMEDLVKNSLRMRPDRIIIGEVRGAEARDMMTAMNIGKIAMGTIHASTARDVITRLQHTPMNVEMDIIPLIDAIVIVSQVYEKGKAIRKVTQVSEISGVETQVLLSDLYTYDYKTHKSSDILPSVTYRDTLSRLTGYPPSEIIIEEERRAKILERLNQLGVTDLKSINEFVKLYYENPMEALKKINLENLGTLPW
ncbi:MAG: CpaF family protein [Candidatus Micrarchaeia archaeon]